MWLGSLSRSEHRTRWVQLAWASVGSLEGFGGGPRAVAFSECFLPSALSRNLPPSLVDAELLWVISAVFVFVGGVGLRLGRFVQLLLGPAHDLMRVVERGRNSPRATTDSR